MPIFNFPPTSRYYNLPVLSLGTADGRVVKYLSRRFVPKSDQFVLLHTHTVTEGERLDLIAARELGDSQAFWRICDANDAMRPDDLTAVPGRVLRITLPQGIPGTTGS
jgi:hypothetical protein